MQSGHSCGSSSELGFKTDMAMTVMVVMKVNLIRNKAVCPKICSTEVKIWLKCVFFDKRLKNFRQNLFDRVLTAAAAAAANMTTKESQCDQNGSN